MKPVIKRIIAITSAAVAAVLITVLVLCLVTVKPIERLGGYDRIYVLESYNHRLDKNDEVLNKGMETVKFSIMRSLWEKQTDYKVKPVIVQDKEGNDVQNKFNADEFSDFRPRNGEFMIELNYNKNTTSESFTDDDGNEIHYDKIILIIPMGEDKIQDVKLYPYLQSNMDGGVTWSKPDADGRVARWAYNVYEFTAKMYTFDFYEIVKEFYTPASGGMVA